MRSKKLGGQEFMENNKQTEAKKPEEKISTKMVNGHTISYDAKAAPGVRHMSEWAKEEDRKAAFQKAAATGSATFKDAYGYSYKVVYHNGKYTVEKK